MKLLFPSLVPTLELEEREAVCTKSFAKETVMLNKLDVGQKQRKRGKNKQAQGKLVKLPSGS